MGDPQFLSQDNTTRRLVLIVWEVGFPWVWWNLKIIVLQGLVPCNTNWICASKFVSGEWYLINIPQFRSSTSSLAFPRKICVRCWSWLGTVHSKFSLRILLKTYFLTNTFIQHKKLIIIIKRIPLSQPCAKGVRVNVQPKCCSSLVNWLRLSCNSFKSNAENTNILY